MSLSDLGLIRYQVVTPGQTDRIPIANTCSQQYLPVQLLRVKITKSVCNSNTEYRTTCDVRLRYYLPSASAMDVWLQSPVPQLTSGERQARREGGPGKGRRVKFLWSKVGGMFQSE